MPAHQQNRRGTRRSSFKKYVEELGKKVPPSAGWLLQTAQNFKLAIGTAVVRSSPEFIIEVQELMRQATPAERG